MDATGEKPPDVDALLTKLITLVGLQEAVRKTVPVSARTNNAQD
jgi:hypothetical protein